MRRIGRKIEPHEAGIAKDAGEKVVEVVRDAPGQETKPLKFLLLLHLALQFRLLRLEALALCDVHRRAGNGLALQGCG